ncbi:MULTISPECIES: methyltransferase domain-containing protein [unclassified Paraflavitalea]|uniref:methyltransferase domain-containing protein n=1 Tax=unclassified Paraflavitalea TaxID=2798305 RepID=UPI003D32CA6F
MPDFNHRSYQKELLDQPDIPEADIRRNMVELDFINTHLGGHAITAEGFRTLLISMRAVKRPIVIAELGCGGGDNLRVVADWCKKHSIDCKFIGIDLNPWCIAYGKEKHHSYNIEWICSDYSKVQFESKPDIVFSSLFCHHFTDTELVAQLKWMNENTGFGWFINDLQRHPLAYHSIKLLTGFFSKSYLVKNDAPLSVLRGFSKLEWTDLLKKAEIDNANLSWKWAFRWLIVHHH